jgi:hypothetical protein
MTRRATRTFEVCVSAHVALRMFITIILASELHFLANTNAGPPLFWQENCINLG